MNRTSTRSRVGLAAFAVLALLCPIVMGERGSLAHAVPPDPVRRGVIVDDDVGGSSTAGIFTNNITTLGGGGGTRSSALRITIGLTSTTSALNLLVIKGSSTIVIPLNGGTALTSAAGLHTFVVGVTTAMSSDTGSATTLTYNLSLTTATRVGFCVVEECQSDDL